MYSVKPKLTDLYKLSPMSVVSGGAITQGNVTCGEKLACWNLSAATT